MTADHKDRPTLFPMPPAPNPGAYGRTKGIYDDARCLTCGCPWESHPADCPRHEYRPGASKQEARPC